MTNRRKQNPNIGAIEKNGTTYALSFPSEGKAQSGLSGTGTIIQRTSGIAGTN
jgi:hypothetical protein